MSCSTTGRLRTSAKSLGLTLLPHSAPALAPIAAGGFGRGDQGYLCGPPPMMHACRDMLARLGVQTETFL
jgi:NAD(P)H-flavin reductase